MVGPLLDVGTVRSNAGRDLSNIVGAAWDTSIKLYASGMSFQVTFPECGARFSATSMLSRDEPNMSPTDLQARQLRVKLVMTPVIILRDDRGFGIKAKMLHPANVLVMK